MSPHPLPYLNARNDLASKGSSDDLALAASCSYQHVDSDLNVKQGNTNINFELLKKLANEWAPIGSGNVQTESMQDLEPIQTDGNIMDDEVIMKIIGQSMLHDGETDWPELKFQVAKLMEETLWQQAELVRRNAEKKLTIHRLQLQVEQLKRQNMALQDSISFFIMGGKRHRCLTSKLHQLWDKLFRRDQ